ncbi:MAG: translation elongation factor G [Omnitrophica WOR_2 bacterium RIFCSPHIGHO2_02_FULL_52_10]|nr:MAG: translation elongation factor G [Omnitrophica WOR_2 bacterium RIFCSPHIGHO2_02_FULL_52_10]
MADTVPLNDVRNIGIIAHIDAGKTTTTERILYYTGVIHKMGNVDDGNTTMDWMEQEQERGITITAANTTCFWNKKKINIIDTPGHVDFTMEVERSLKVLDGAVVVLCATSGVQSQTETVWRQADRYGVPRVAFINKLDRLGASFERVLGEIHERLGANAAAIQFPNASEEAFNAIVDIVENNYRIYKNDVGDDIEVTDIPEAFKAKTQDLRRKLIERLADADDKIAELYLEEKEITKEELKAAIRRSVVKNAFLPVLCGSSLKNKGVQLLLDAVCDYLPSPLDLPPVRGIDPSSKGEITRDVDPNAPLSALIFKVATDPYVGKLFYTRLYSGTITQGTQIYNASEQKRERVSKILIMHANKQEIVNKASAGEIIALVGLKESKSGNTLCDSEKMILIENMRIPEPVVSMSIEPKTKADQDKLGLTLRKFLDEDPSLRVDYDQETAQTIISGMGELHLEIIIDRMKREFGLETRVGRPEVAYKETLTQKVMGVVGKHISQTGGRGQYGHVVINVEPAEEKGKGIVFVDKIKGGSIPREYIKPIEKGIMVAAQTGVLAGYPVVDFTVTLVDGSYHEVDSSELAFQLAARNALKEALQKGKSVFLEPIMDIEVISPEGFMGAVLGDLNQRRAKIVSMGNRGSLKMARCDVPLAEMFNYVNAVRSLTQGRASFSMEPAYYDQVPVYIAEKIIGARQDHLANRKN